MFVVSAMVLMKNSEKMKKLILLALVAICACSCINSEDYSKELNEVFSGKHELRRLTNIDVNTSSSISASYFLFWGSAQAKGESSNQFVAFSWRLKNGEYVFSKVNPENIRLIFDNKISTPYITFGYNPELMYGVDGKPVNSNIPYLVQYQISYIVIHCKESDYTKKININDLR